MPLQVTPWASPDPATGDGNPLTAKSLNIALYTINGSGDHPNGIAFQACRPILFEAKAAALTLLTSPAGTRTVLATSSTTTVSAFMVMDAAGYFGQTSDLPGKGYYQYAAIIAGSSGDGVSPGGWMILCHFASIAGQSTQTSVGADMNVNGSVSRSGTRFPSSSSHDSTPFCLDLRNVGTSTWQPSVFVDDSASTSTTLLANTTDPSGETSKFYAIWAGVASGGIGTESFTAAGTYNFTAPPGVTSVSVTCIGSGGGGGAGQGAYGGGGGGGGEAAQNTTVAVTSGSNYTAVVGAGGTAGAEPGGNGGAGAASTFAGDSQTVTGNGGGAGTGAGVSGNGSGGAGGTGSTAPTHYGGGAGAGGSTGKYGGGGGSSASPTAAGTAGSGASGGPAPSGGGNGGNGGTDTITVVQMASGSDAGGNAYVVSFPQPVQAGNAVIVAVCADGAGTPGANGRVSAVILYDGVGIPVGAPGGSGGVIVSPGTPLTSRASAQVSGSPNASYTYIWDVAEVPGGQQAVYIAYGGSSERRSLAYIYEVAGLGPTITVDTSSTGANRGSFYTSGPVSTADGPDLWVAACGWQGTDPASIYSAGSPWVQQKQISSGDFTGGNNLALRPGYSIQARPGRMIYSGNLSIATGYAAVAVAYSTSAATPGNSPAAPPGGGGGGGLGAFNGGTGSDGSVTLTWAGQAGSAYGTPAPPSPVAAWTTASEITATLLNGSSGIAGVCNFLNSPPLFSVLATTAVPVPTATVQVMTQFGGGTDVDNYSGWNRTSNTYTVQRDGLYVCHALVPFTAQAGGSRLAGLKINGTIYWGPGYLGNSAEHTHCSKTQVFGLHAGDTVQLVCWQNSGATITLATADPTRFFLAWLGGLGSPAASWVPPDPGYRWQSGTPGSDLPDLFQAHLANDLGFLVNRPYLVAYQATAQSGLPANGWSTVTLDTVGGIVHGDVGDSYNGWGAGASNSYMAPVNGWYLMCGEFFTTATSSGSVVAGIAPSTSGGYAPSATPDWYQHMAASTTASAPPGATVFGLQYMQAGESITPQVNGQSYPGAYGTTAGGVTGGQVNSHLAVIWMSL